MSHLHPCCFQGLVCPPPGSREVLQRGTRMGRGDDPVSRLPWANPPQDQSAWLGEHRLPGLPRWSPLSVQSQL